MHSSFALIDTLPIYLHSLSSRIKQEFFNKLSSLSQVIDTCMHFIANSGKCADILLLLNKEAM